MTRITEENRERLVEIVDARERVGQYFCTVGLKRGDAAHHFRFGVTREDYRALKRILQRRPFDAMPGLRYRHWFVSYTRRIDDEQSEPEAEVLIEVGRKAKQFSFSAPERLVANLLWFATLEDPAEASHLQVAVDDGEPVGMGMREGEEGSGVKPLSEAGEPRTYGTGAVNAGDMARRYIASLFDLACVLAGWYGLSYVVLEYSGFPVENVLLFIGALFVLFVPVCGMVLYLPELLTGRTLGMLLFGLVVVAPPERPVWRSLLVRKAANVREVLGGGISYYLGLALGKDGCSPSERASGCRVVRRRHLTAPRPGEGEMPSRAMKLALALLFIALFWVPLVCALIAAVFLGPG